MRSTVTLSGTLSMFATILLIGDSHTFQSFGRNLDGLLRTLPQARVETLASWGTSPGGWFDSGSSTPPLFERDVDGRVTELKAAPTPNFVERIKCLHPDLTIIALGANLYNAPFDYSADSVRLMADTVARTGSACLWIGPPDMRDRSGAKMTELYGVLRGASLPCKFFDSREVTHYPATGGDGLHYDYLGPAGLAQAHDWAQKVFETVSSQL